MKFLNDYNELIKQWSIDKGLHIESPKIQMLKVVEEFGEIDEAQTKEDLMDAIGDSYVTLVIIAQQLGIEEFSSCQNDRSFSANLGRLSGFLVRESKIIDEIEATIECLYHNLLKICRLRGVNFLECLSVAYNEIKDRKGKMIDGTFVKADDL